MLPWENLLDDVEGGVVELKFNILSWSQIACIMGMESMSDAPP